MEPGKLFCFGYGYVAAWLSQALKEADPAWRVIGTTRDIEKRNQLKDFGIKSYLFDYDSPIADPSYVLEDVTHVLIATPPGDDGDPSFIAHAQDLLHLPNLKWVGYLSSTAVYGDHNGEWVDEGSELQPSNKRGSRRARGESQWLHMYEQYDLPVHIFRLAGIYGPGRSAIDSVRAGNARRIDKPGHFFSRVHIGDIVSALIRSIENPNPGRVYNISDDKPSPSHELITYASQLLDIEPPPMIRFSQADMAPIARSFYMDTKRIMNKRMKEELGVELKYPTYKEGLDACLNGQDAIPPELRPDE